jgi:hypothetical protein
MCSQLNFVAETLDVGDNINASLQLLSLQVKLNTWHQETQHDLQYGLRQLLKNSMQAGGKGPFPIYTDSAGTISFSEGLAEIRTMWERLG